MATPKRSKTAGKGGPPLEPAKSRGQAKTTPKPRAKTQAKPKAATAAVRNADIYRDSVRGLSPLALSKKYDVSARRCEQIVAELERSDVSLVKLRDARLPMKFAEKLIRAHTESISEMGELADQARSENNLAAVLGATRRRDEASGRLQDLLVKLNLLPRNLGAATNMVDAILMAETAVDVLQDAGTPDDVIERFVAAMDVKTGRDKGQLVLVLGEAPEVPDDGGGRRWRSPHGKTE
jgi:hypothetical protein